MTMYNPLVPTGSVPLNIDYQNLQNNFQQLDTTYAVDHVAYSVAPQNGYHKSMHMVSASTITSNPPNNQPVLTPVATPGFGQVFSAQIANLYSAGDEVLYFLSGGNRLTQLTNTFIPTAAAIGCTTLPGGIVVQWGKISAAGGNAIVPVTFTVVGIRNYATANFGVWTTIVNATGSGSPSCIFIPAVSTTGFSYQNSASTAKDFYWISIGK